MRRVLIVLAMVVGLIGALAVPASATKPGTDEDLIDGHKILICHATRSLTNPYVVIEIDIAAWNDPSDDKNHGDHHTRTKDGITWSDKLANEDGTCDDVPEPEPEYCNGVEVETLLKFDRFMQNVDGERTATVTGLDIPEGMYKVVLGSYDPNHAPELTDAWRQLNEQWRVVFNGDTSGWSGDLAPNDYEDAWSVGTVDINRTMSITLQHWNFVYPETSFYDEPNTDFVWNSIHAECIGLTPTD
jgi:hypothetical protein